mmetsp:Transcript_169189/g.543877  ORF Transcript_169189/g.543877 Transcript_169189/m.543877 type:complete len:227 (+) Transcript_169189:1858-2538(+)
MSRSEKVQSSPIGAWCKGQRCRVDGTVYAGAASRPTAAMSIVQMKVRQLRRNGSSWWMGWRQAPNTCSGCVLGMTSTCPSGHPRSARALPPAPCPLLVTWPRIHFATRPSSSPCLPGIRQAPLCSCARSRTRAALERSSPAMWPGACGRPCCPRAPWPQASTSGWPMQLVGVTPSPCRLHQEWYGRPHVSQPSRPLPRPRSANSSPCWCCRLLTSAGGWSSDLRDF